jgi:probable addiction module antidote protein
MIHYRTHDEYLMKVLKDPKEAASFLNAACEENDQRLILRALMQVAKAHGISKIAKKSSISRMGLYKALSGKTNPELKTFLRVIRASSLQIAFQVAA